MSAGIEPRGGIVLPVSAFLERKEGCSVRLLLARLPVFKGARRVAVSCCAMLILGQP